jgi:hypothetical protein
MNAPMRPITAPLHFRSSHVLEVGAGSARRSFRSSISKAGTSPAYARSP